jgi:hypothetical protein
LTIRQMAIIGGVAGVVVSGAVLTLLWMGVGGIVMVGGIDLMYVLWPSSLMLTVGWRRTAPGITITVLAVAINCLLYAGIALALGSCIKRIRKGLRP